MFTSIVKADHEIDVLQKDNQTPVRQQHVLKPFGKEIIVEINMTGMNISTGQFLFLRSYVY